MTAAEKDKAADKEAAGAVPGVRDIGAGAGGGGQPTPTCAAHRALRRRPPRQAAPRGRGDLAPGPHAPQARGGGGGGIFGGGVFGGGQGRRYCRRRGGSGVHLLDAAPSGREGGGGRGEARVHGVQAHAPGRRATHREADEARSTRSTIPEARRTFVRTQADFKQVSEEDGACRVSRVACRARVSRVACRVVRKT